MRVLGIAVLAAIVIGGVRVAVDFQRPSGNATDVPEPDAAPLRPHAILDLRTITHVPDDQFVGREVALRDVVVARADESGFWLTSDGGAIFVTPAEGALVSVAAGDTVSVHGELRPMTDDMRRTLARSEAAIDDAYVYAFTVRPTGIVNYDVRWQH